MPIFINDEQTECVIDHDKLKGQIRDILTALKCEKKEISILLADDKRMRELNKQYRGQDRSTDVLSFPQNEGKEEGFHTHLLGDVVISTATAQRQSAQHKLSLEEELVLLLTHGILHLLGYDHERSEEETIHMKKKTRELFFQIFLSFLYDILLMYLVYHYLVLMI